jgi:hypothetical protein
MSLVERLHLDKNVNMEKRKCIELKVVIVNYSTDFRKSFKCGCLMVINCTRCQMDLRKLVSFFFQVLNFFKLRFCIVHES